MNYLLDTNVISELVSEQPERRVIAWIDAIDPANLYLSVITIGEIVKGIEKLPAGRRQSQLQAWLRDGLLIRFQNRICPIDTDVMIKWGNIAAASEKSGRPLRVIDSLVAAIAVQNHFTLATRNVSDFVSLGIPIENPWT